MSARRALIALLGTTLAATAIVVPADAASDGEDRGFVVWVPTGSLASSSLERVPRSSEERAPGAGPSELRLTAVRNGPMSAQLAVTAQRPLTNLTARVVAGAPQGVRPLPASATTVRFPGYVPVEGTDEVTADPLLDGPVDVAEGDNQPIWLTIDVPASLPAGTYGLRLRIGAENTRPVTRDVVVDVAEVTLDEDRAFYLNLWLQPDAVAYAHDVPVHSEAHWRLLEPYLRDLASRGQKVINAAIIEDPWEIGWPDGTWRAQTYYPFHSLVDWVYDGARWSFDYTAFDRYVRASRRAGIGPDIRVYALLMFGGRERLFYRDTRTGETVREVVELGDARWREAWSAFLEDFERHLRERGWFDDTMLAFDERPSATMKVVQDFLAESAPAFADKVHIAVHSMDVDHTIPDISYAHGLLSQLSDELLDQRREAGHRTTFYTTGGPLSPNTITATPPIGTRYLPWIPVQRDLDGYLRWSYNSWPSDDPLLDPAYRYAQGDEYIVYPGGSGPISSIRWETFRDGVIDHELLRQLARRATEDHPAYRRALELVDTDAQPSPASNAALLEARQVVVQELERRQGTVVRLDADPRETVAGDRLEVVATVENDGRRPLTDLDVELVAGPGWEVELVDGGRADRLAPGQVLRSRFAVTVPTTAATATEHPIVNITVRRKGERVSLTNPVPLDVRAAAGIESLTADPESPGRGETVTLTGRVVNRRPERTEADVSVAAPDGWTVTPASVFLDLAPRAEKTVIFEARPSDAAAPGRRPFESRLAVERKVVETASTTVTYDEERIAGATIHRVSSEELVGEDGAATNLVDGDPQTHWHSRWFDSVAGPPHEVVLDLVTTRSLHALAYLPRQTGTLNGGVKAFEVYVGDDPDDADGWGEPVARGEFEGGRDEQRVDFAPTSARYVRFVVLSEQFGQPFASGAELTPIGRSR